MLVEIGQISSKHFSLFAEKNKKDFEQHYSMIVDRALNDFDDDKQQNSDLLTRISLIELVKKVCWTFIYVIYYKNGVSVFFERHFWLPIPSFSLY